MNFDELTEFEKDLKKLLKKYRTLKEDLEIIKLVLETIPEPRPPFSFQIENLGLTTCVIKIKKIACRSMKGRGVNSGFRLVYAYFEKEEKIIFVELYHKNEKVDFDKIRILKYFV